MSRFQWIVVSLAALLFAGLYFGFENKPDGHEKLEQKRALVGESTDETTILSEAKTKLSPTDRAAIEQNETNAQKPADGSPEKIAALKNVASVWFQKGSPAASGIFAQKVAELENSDAAWSIAGATFQIAGAQATDEKTRSFCGKRAIKAFENAVSLDAKNVGHQVNLASVYADFPPADNPMKAVLMLRDLEAKNPDNTLVLNALGRLAIRTGQWEKAIARFEKSLSLDPKNRQATCLLADAYRGAKQEAKAAEMDKKCAAISK